MTASPLRPATTSTLVLALTAPAGWAELAAVWRGVQAELDLPAPAIAVDGTAGCQLWFRLARAVPLEEARAVLAALCARWLAQVPPAAITLAPPAELAAPPREVAPGRWSAWVAADLAPLFADEPWLDHPPGAQAQAELWTRSTPVSAEAWAALRARLLPSAPPAPAAGAAVALAVPAPAPAAGTAAAAEGDADARAFLRSVMRDPAAPLALRIEAAKALLVAPAAQA
jgi:hypothetical protein